MKICLISNYEDTSIDHSEFIDSCDVVMRVNRMTNYDSGHVGSKTTHLWVHAGSTLHLMIDDSYKVMLEDIPNVIMSTDTWDMKYQIPRFKKEIKEDFVFDKTAIGKVGQVYTSVVLAYKYLQRNFPNETIHFIGDVSRTIRIPETDDRVHTFWKEQLNADIMVHIKVSETDVL